MQEQNPELKEYQTMWADIMGQQVKLMREAAGMTQQQLAYISEVAVSTLSNIEGGGGFNLSTLFALSFALKVAPEDFFDVGINGRGSR